MIRQSFQFAVSGAEQAGVLYVTMTYDRATYPAALAKATKIAAKRSGDTSPVFIRTINPIR